MADHHLHSREASSASFVPCAPRLRPHPSARRSISAIGPVCCAHFHTTGCGPAKCELDPENETVG